MLKAASGASARFLRFFNVPVGEKRIRLLKSWGVFDAFADAPCESTFKPGCKCCMSEDCFPNPRNAIEYYTGVHLCWHYNQNWLRDEQSWLEANHINGQVSWEKWIKEQQVVHSMLNESLAQRRPHFEEEDTQPSTILDYPAYLCEYFAMEQALYQETGGEYCIGCDRKMSDCNSNLNCDAGYPSTFGR